MENNDIFLENNDILIEYILGGLSEPERERLEEEYFVNNETWEKLRAVEDDLIDSYVRGKLPLRRREQFEKYFLASPSKRQRVEFARTLNDAAAREATAEARAGWQKSGSWFWMGGHPALRFALTAAALVLAVAAVFPVIQNVGLRRDLRQSRSREIELQNQIQSLQQQLAAAKTNHLPGDAGELFSAQAATISLMLTPGLVRNGKNGEQAHVLPVPTTPAEVLLLFSLESDEYPQYGVLLRTAEGREVRHVEGLTSRLLPQGNRVVALRLPAQLFSPGDYIATLSGKTAKGKTQTVDSYTFSVTR